MCYNMEENKGGVFSVVKSLTDELAKAADVLTYNISVKYVGFKMPIVQKSIRTDLIQYIINFPKLFCKFPQLIRIIIEMPFIYIISKRINPDILHVHGTVGSYALAAACVKKHKILTVHGLYGDQINFREAGICVLRNINNKLIRALEAYVLKKFKNIIVISPYIAKKIERLKIKGLKINIYEIPNPVSMEFYKSEDLKMEYRKDRNIKNILYAGRIWPLKGVKELVHGFNLLNKRFPDSRLIVVGDAITKEDFLYLEEIKNYIVKNQLDEKIVFLGFLSMADVIIEILKCEVVVLFSFQESSPMIIAEAMALKKPVIVSDIPGIGHLVKDGRNGYVVKKGDCEKLSKRLEELLRNNELRNCFCEESFKKSKRFEPSLITEKTIRAYTEVLNSKK